LKAVEKDRNTVMMCTAQGIPEPNIYWLKDFIPVDYTDPRLKQLAGGTHCQRKHMLPCGVVFLLKNLGFVKEIILKE
jgi:hypothetical protein